jgi:protein ImuB
MFCCVYHESAAALAARFSPWCELASPDTAIFDAGRVERLLGGPEQIARAIWEQSGRRANVALAAVPDAAFLAARNFPGITIIRDAAGGLAELVLESLPIEPDLLGTFAAWGIRTLGDLAALPENGLASRMGERALALQRLARGAIRRPLQIRKPPEIYADRIALDHPIELLEPLLFLLARILNGQCDRLTAHGLAANEIRVTLTLDDRSEYVRTLRLPVPMRDGRALLKLLQMDLEAHPPQAAMTAVAVALNPVEPRRVQHGLFVPQAPAPDKLELTLARIRGLVGEENVGVPELLDTHRPAPFRLVGGHAAPAAFAGRLKPAPHIAFRYFHPPLPAKVELHGERPARLTAPGIYGRIVSAAGPWRTSGEWWTLAPWNRDEWDVALNDGALYRIYSEPGGCWHVEGAYD